MSTVFPATAFEVPSGRQLSVLGQIRHPQFDPARGVLLAFAYGRTNALMERYWVPLEHPERKEPFGVQDDQQRPFVFSSDGRFLATTTAYRHCRLLDGRTGRELAVLSAPVAAGGNDAVALSRDGAWLASYNNPGVFQLWNLALIRSQLAALGLDWELPPVPVPPPPVAFAGAPGPADRWRVWIDATDEHPPEPLSRRADTPSSRVDLGPVHNGWLERSWHLEDGLEVDSIGMLPRCRVTLRGIPHDVRGLVRAGGHRVSGQPFPRTVPGITMGTPARAFAFSMPRSGVPRGAVWWVPTRVCTAAMGTCLSRPSWKACIRGTGAAPTGPLPRRLRWRGRGGTAEGPHPCSDRCASIPSIGSIQALRFRC